LKLEEEINEISGIGKQFKNEEWRGASWGECGRVL